VIRLALAFAAALGPLVALAQEAPPDLPEGNAYVKGLVTRQREREAALNRYTYDVEEVEERLDGDGKISEAKTRRFEVFYVKGSPVRKKVAQNGGPLPPGDAEKEERRVTQQVEDILEGRTVREVPGVRLSQILERYDFNTVAREMRDGRTNLVFAFEPREGKRDLKGDFVLRRLAGRIWVDEEERELVRAELKSTGKIKVAFGLGASVESVSVTVQFRKLEDNLWLPARVVSEAAGRRFVFSRFHVRATALYTRYRRFEAEAEPETIAPPH
jgi:hypothetical protein